MTLDKTQMRSLSAMNCPPAWAGEHSDKFAFMLAGALSRVMLPDDQEMPEQEIRETIEMLNSAGPGPWPHEDDNHYDGSQE